MNGLNSRRFATQIGMLIAVAVVIYPSVYQSTMGFMSAALSALESICLGTIEEVGGHPHSAHAGSLAALLAIAVVALFALAAALRRVNRTRNLLSLLLQSEVSQHPADLEQASRTTGLAGRVSLIESPHFFAFCYGLIKPKVCVSTRLISELNSAELEAVLRHEAWHLKNKDPWKNLLADATASALFFLPVAKDLARHRAARRELTADAAAIAEMRDRRPLAAALYKGIELGAASVQLPATVGAFSAIDARIDQILGGSVAAGWAGGLERSNLILSLPFVVATILAVCLLVTAATVGSGSAGVCYVC